MSLDGTFKRIMSSFPLSEVASLILEIMEAIFTALFTENLLILSDSPYSLFPVFWSFDLNVLEK